MRELQIYESAPFYLELFHFEIGNHLKVPWISGHYSKSQMQRGRSDQQILERDLHAMALLLAVSSTGKKSDSLRERIDWNVGQQFLNEGLAACAYLWRVGSMDSMDQFDQRDGGERRFRIAHAGEYLLEQLRHCLATSFRRDENAESRINPIAKRPAARDGIE